MTILYIVGNGSKHGNIELRWSLRSLAKFGRNVGRVIVAGSPPAWLSGDVERFSYDQPYNRTNRNIPATAAAAVDALGLRGDVVMAYDDCILTADTDFDALPLMCRGWSLPSSANGGNNYFKALVETRAFLESHDLPTIDFEQHAFKVFSADALLAHADLVRGSYASATYGVTADCLFTNLTLRADPTRQVVFRKDVKVRQMTDADLHAGFCTSFSDACFDDPGFIPRMDAFLGEPCRYEKEGA